MTWETVRYYLSKLQDDLRDIVGDNADVCIQAHPGGELMVRFVWRDREGIAAEMSRILVTGHADFDTETADMLRRVREF